MPQGLPSSNAKDAGDIQAETRCQFFIDSSQEEKKMEAKQYLERTIEKMGF